MADQLQEMLQRIYEDGVNKAKNEAQEILGQAKQQADAILSNAGKDAEKIISDAKQKAAELEKNLTSDLKMAATQAMSALKNKVVNALLIEVLDKQTTTAMSDSAFVQQLILEILKKWTPESSLVLTVPEAKKAELESFFQTSATTVFKGKLKVDYSPVFKNGITVAPADGTFKLSFTDEDFANFFKAYLRPKASQILFGA
jgi:V/A-type H+-transporting ATPase subunit E